MNGQPDKDYVTDVAPMPTLPILRANCTTLLAFLVKQVENGFTIMAEISYLDPETKNVKGVEQRNYVATKGNGGMLGAVQEAIIREVEGYPGYLLTAEGQRDLFKERTYRDMLSRMGGGQAMSADKAKPTMQNPHDPGNYAEFGKD